MKTKHKLNNEQMDWLTNLQLKDIFNAAFYKGISNDSELPIERAICTLCVI